MPAYLQEMARFEEDADAEGELSYPYLDHYWREPDRIPYVIRENHQDSGFALVRFVRSGDTTPDYHSIAEFYIQPEFRRGGLGARTAEEILSEFTGIWLVQVLEHNHAARKFWEAVLQPYCEPSFEDRFEESFEPEFDGRFFNYWLTR